MLGCTFMLLCFCTAAGAQISHVKDSLKQSPQILNNNNRVIKNNPATNGVNNNEEAARAAMAEKLANELKNIGVSLSQDDLTAIQNAMTSGGQAAMALARLINISITEIKENPDFKENDAAANSSGTFTKKQANALLAKLKLSRADSLELARFLKPRIEKLRN